MGAKLWGGILLGAFVVAVGVELARRKCPGLTKKVSNGAKKAVEATATTIENFTKTARSSFHEGYSSAKT